jgi:hypothetical protein
MVRGFNDEEITKSFGSKPKLRAELRAVDTVPPGEDKPSELVDLGMVLRATQQNTAAINGLTVQVGTLSREVSQHGKTLDEGRGDLVKDASKSAAKHTSNRMGALIGALVVLWEVASPYIHQLMGNR